jgi:hypothetical protein
MVRLFIFRHCSIRAACAALTFASCLAIVAFAPAPARAGFMPDFTGYTQMSDSATATDVVNFAVYNNTSGDWATALGVTPTAGADTSASYVYMYEVVNNGGATSRIGSFNVNSYDQPYTSSGYLSGTVFSDGAAVGPAGNQYLGANPGSMPADDPVNDNPSVSGVAAPTFASSGGAINPLGSNTGGSINSDFASFGFFNLSFNQTLTSGLFSSVLFLTSNVAPTYSEGQVLNTSTSSFSTGGIPTQAPEPATLAIWGLGTLGVAFAVRRRKRRAGLSA